MRWWMVVLGALALAGTVGGVWLGSAYHEHVVRNPGRHLDRASVLAVVADESPVFFRDGSTRVGVFFDGEHRAFVPWERLPVAWTASIVAAEDDGFFFHEGIEPTHVARAMRDNIRAGKMVAGGSTLTQQTAKNLFYRPDRSLRSKLDEALNALRLEAHFGKHEILTFYANQFHVVGNGRGLGIAARYFFDADVDELSLLQCAFLAGLVKGPAAYDPFRGNPTTVERARSRAHDRTRYVLKRLIEEPADRLAGGADLPGGEAGRLQRVQAVQALQKEAATLLASDFDLPFAQGTFRYASSALLDEVERRLAQPPFGEVLQRAGVTDPAGEGLRVLTTLDADVQRSATYALWHHLTEAGTMLERLGPEAFLRPSGDLVALEADQPLRVGEFRVAKVVASEATSAKELSVDLGGRTCLVDERAVRRVADAIRRGAAKSAWSKAASKDVAALIEALTVGSNVWVSVREVVEAGPLCDLEVRPELQGAVVVIDDGQIRAMVGGNDNQNFNRATAGRQLGSTWKPLVAHAAIELGWRPDDVLDNRSTSFAFSASVYAPRADHASTPDVSMGLAIAQSENVASVWLMYHLLDHLDHGSLGALAERLGLAREASESEDAYALRIQRLGVLPTPSRTAESHVLLAKQEVLAGLLAQGKSHEAAAVRSVVYGWGLSPALHGGGEGQVPTWSWLTGQAGVCAAAWASQQEAVLWGDVVAVQSGTLRWTLEEEGAVAHCGGSQGTAWDPAWPLLLAPRERMVIADRWTLGTVEGWQSSVDRLTLAREIGGAESPGLYDLSVLAGHQDFRVLLAMRYVTALAAHFGVRTPLEEVLSLPLGAADITLEEAAMLYDGLLTGASWSFPGEAMGGGVPAPPSPALLVSGVRTVEGRSVYDAGGDRSAVTSPLTGAMTRDLLRGVVDVGTGKRARGAVSFVDTPTAPLPILGKTGTTNSHRNAAFVGAVPRVEGGEIAGHWVIAVYVGYDDNRPLKNGGLSLAGASGALPAWLGTAQGVARSGVIGHGPAPEGGWQWPVPEGLVAVPIAADDPEGATLLVPIASGPPSDSVDWGDLTPPDVPVRLEPVSPPSDWFGAPVEEGLPAEP